MLMTVLAAVLALPASYNSARLHIAVVFDGGASASSYASIVEEAARVWAPYGVDVHDGASVTCAPPDVLTLHVAMMDTPGLGVNNHALGSIPFRADVPDAAISLYAGTASGLVSAAASGSISHWPVALHNAVLARVLGRALAHEIGHYLLRTREHAASGLMRADLPIMELMEVTDSRLTLSAEQEAVLRRVEVVRAGQPGVDRTHIGSE